MSGVLALSLAACGSSSQTGSTAAATEAATAAATAAATEGAAETGSNIVNIGVTNQLGTLNPLNMDWSFINLHATSMMFLPLVTVGADNNFNYLLAESVTTDDNLTFTVKIRDDAVWSDGEPVTADDVIFTILRMTSPEVANANFDFSMFKGFESGTSPEGADSIEGLKKVDDKTVQFVANTPMSLNTFLNAMTYTDKTVYPVASRNAKDFRNLADVYLDAVFYPLTGENPFTLRQEGWHYELGQGEDKPLVYNGVVYNEMKGVYSSPDAIEEHEVMKALFPDSPYRFESGGLPSAIPQLTQEGFVDFHKKY